MKPRTVQALKTPVLKPKWLAPSSFVSVIEVLFAVILWGASFVATKVALREVSPATVIWLRFGIGFLVLGSVVLYRRQLVMVSTSEAGYFALLGFIGITFHQWLQVEGLKTSQASTTGWIIATIPVFIAIFDWKINKEQLSLRQWLGVFIASMGVLGVMSKGEWENLAGSHAFSVGDLLVFLSAPNWAVFTLLSRKSLTERPASLVIFYTMGFGWLAVSGGWLSFQCWRELVNISTSGWLAVLFLGVFCSGFAYIFWYDALQELGAVRSGAFLYLEPLVTVFLARILLHEAITLLTIAGGFSILFGVWMVNQKAT